MRFDASIADIKVDSFSIDNLEVIKNFRSNAEASLILK